jgi:uncharacterized membrane protein YgcG
VVIIYESVNIMVTNSAFLASSASGTGRQAATLIKREEYFKECNLAAALIQRNFRKHLEERAFTFSLKSSLATSVLGNSSATTIALSFGDDDDRSSSEDYSSYEDEDQVEDNAAPEKRSRKHFWGNLAAGAAGLISVGFVSRMMGGAPVDEDDVVGNSGMVNSGGGGGGGGGAPGGGGGSAGGGGATGAATSAQ